MSKKINTQRVSNEEVETLFEKEFDAKVAVYNDISEFEPECQKEVGNETITVQVMVVGSAGSPTIDDWKTGKVENADSVRIAREDIGELEFKLDPAETLYLNSNDYYVYYKSV